MFCAPKLVFGGPEGIGSRFHALRSRTHFRRYRGRQMPFSCFALPDSFPVVPWASTPFFMFCAPELIFGYSEGVGSHFITLCSRTRFRRYCGRRLLFFIFCAPRLIFDGTEGVGSRLMLCVIVLVFCGSEGVRSHFHVLRSRTRFRRRASGPVFMICAPEHVFDCTEGVGDHFNVFRFRTHFRRFRRRQVPFSCFALPDMLSRGVESVGSRFHVLHS
jgi:hypothetical protein